ncbi:MAG: AAA family ATPase [Candidatus Zixiibacteriota bacterium]
MRRVIAIANQKGGVGKTTTAVNLSTCMALDGKRTLLIDLDPQANTTSFLGINKSEVKDSTYEVLVAGLPITQAIISPGIERLDLLPSAIRLVGAEVELVGMENRESRLREALNDPHLDYDYVVIDCPPALNMLTLNALVAANSVLIPVQTEYFALEGLGLLLDTIKRVQSSLNRELVLEGVVLTMFDGRLNLSRQVEAEARRVFAGKVYQTVIQRNVRLAEAPGFGKPIVVYDMLSTGADNYVSLAKEVMAT